MDPLTDQACYQAIRALDAGAPLDPAQVHRALLMALALRPALAESALLRDQLTLLTNAVRVQDARIAELRSMLDAARERQEAGIN